jgi:hypothetical protein
VCPITQAAHEPTPSDTSTPLDGHPHLDALRSSVERLRNLAAPMTEQQLPGRAYPTEWTVAQVLSHLGSGAVITQRRLEDVLTGRETPDDFAPSGWDTWNAKSALAQREDALAADAELLARLQAVARQERNRFSRHGTDVVRLRPIRGAAAQRARVPHLGRRGRGRPGRHR